MDETRGTSSSHFCFPIPSLFTPAMQAMGAQLGAADTSRSKVTLRHRNMFG